MEMGSGINKAKKTDFTVELAPSTVETTVSLTEERAALSVVARNYFHISCQRHKGEKLLHGMDSRRMLGWGY
jgi:hypothetical protein